jgi:hypothetical protein
MTGMIRLSKLSDGDYLLGEAPTDKVDGKPFWTVTIKNGKLTNSHSSNSGLSLIFFMAVKFILYGNQWTTKDSEIYTDAPYLLVKV